MVNRKKKNSLKKSVLKSQKTLNAQNADKHILYQKSVQDAEGTVDFIEGVFKSRQNYLPLALREDFCGTALLCAGWVKSDKRRTAVGVDLDKPTLDWGIKHNIEPLKEAASRIRLLNKNVLNVTADTTFDIIVAFNFSYCVFKQRKIMKKYFKKVYNSLADSAVFILDMHGGPDAQFQLEEARDVENFEYIWEQSSFDPITNSTRCNIHFRFKDKSELKNAFTYDWRHWSIPELRDILEEVGFSTIDTWWDGKDDEYAICTSAVNLEAWVAYIAAWK
jgi:cyclopropane fatty-acyl-phospholipid synthase-like methyltransferase